MNHSRSLSAFVVLAFAACASSSAPAPEAASPAAPVAAPSATTPAAAEPSAPAGAAASFSAAQADRGRDTFRGRCTECHYSNEFADSQFKFKWSRRSAGSLYQLIQTSMPETAPGSLSPEETVEIVSYILRMNGFTPGARDLPAEREVLDGISLASIRND